MRIDYGGHAFGTGVPDDNGCLWYVTEMEGWEAPELRHTTVAPSGDHGQVLVEALLDSRSVTLRGVCKAPNEPLFWLSYNNFLALTNNLFLTRELVVYEDVPKVLHCVRGGAPDLSFVGVGSFTFDIMLTAHDPLKYGLNDVAAVIPAGATVTVHNNGTFSTRPTLVTGGKVKVRHVGTKALIETRTGMNVPSGTVFDHRKKTVSKGNANHYDSLTTGSTWWRLEPGPNQIKNEGTDPVTITHRHAWL